MKRTLPVILLAVILGFIIANPGFATSTLRRNLIASGGGKSTGATHTLRGSIGQSAAGIVSSATQTVYVGFWGYLSPVIAVEEASPTAPGTFHLYQNIPNPFNPVTTIKYDVPSDGARVRVVIYGVNGRAVKTLVDGPEPSGQKSVNWDGRDEQGRPMASGIYICSMDAPGYQATRTMVLLR